MGADLPDYRKHYHTAYEIFYGNRGNYDVPE